MVRTELGQGLLEQFLSLLLEGQAGGPQDTGPFQEASKPGRLSVSMMNPKHQAPGHGGVCREAGFVITPFVYPAVVPH